MTDERKMNLSGYEKEANFKSEIIDASLLFFIY